MKFFIDGLTENVKGFMDWDGNKFIIAQLSWTLSKSCAVFTVFHYKKDGNHEIIGDALVSIDRLVDARIDGKEDLSLVDPYRLFHLRDD